MEREERMVVKVTRMETRRDQDVCVCMCVCVCT